MNYLIQAGKGQWAMLSHARPIEEVIKDERTPPQLKSLLTEIKPIKQFGEDHALKPTSNYTEYVKLDRQAAVWLLSACDPLQFKNKVWNFPLVGSFPYLGWFDLQTAQEQAKLLKNTGWDVDLRGAGAYSTLGWFKDPILSTMISSGDESLGDLVNVVLHESVHATLYISGQAFFNESIASFVADQLTTQYLTRTRGLNSKEQQAYIAREKRREQLTQQFHATYIELSKLYASDLTQEIKLHKKEQILSQLQTRVNWNRPLNNAVLIQYQTYTSGQEIFEHLLKYHHSDWKIFIASLKTLQPNSFTKPQQEDLESVLAGLMPS
jgi:predicted aminopeptidase